MKVLEGMATWENGRKADGRRTGIISTGGVDSDIVGPREVSIRRQR